MILRFLSLCAKTRLYICILHFREVNICFNLKLTFHILPALCLDILKIAPAAEYV